MALKTSLGQPIAQYFCQKNGEFKAKTIMVDSSVFIHLKTIFFHIHSTAQFCPKSMRPISASFQAIQSGNMVPPSSGNAMPLLFQLIRPQPQYVNTTELSHTISY